MGFLGCLVADNTYLGYTLYIIEGSCFVVGNQKLHGCRSMLFFLAYTLLYIIGRKMIDTDGDGGRFVAATLLI